MIHAGALTAYSAALLLGTLGGAVLPIVWRPRPHQTDLFISFSAGVLLGAAFFHMLPEALRARGPGVLSGVVLGFLTLLILERFILVHVCEEDECEVHAPGAHEGVAGAASALGLTAFFGLSLHTLSDGFALGAAVGQSADPLSGLGAIVFAAIFAHQLPTSFSLSAILRRSGRSSAGTLLYCAAFALSVPAGILVYLGVASRLSAAALVPWALAFSAGNFLHLALSDLIPDLHRRGTQRLPLSLALLSGIAMMWALHVAMGD
ncbi:MAG: ZIP family metal transporter [Deltaproteobacteria bacterium]